MADEGASADRGGGDHTRGVTCAASTAAAVGATSGAFGSDQSAGWNASSSAPCPRSQSRSTRQAGRGAATSDQKRGEWFGSLHGRARSSSPRRSRGRGRRPALVRGRSFTVTYAASAAAPVGRSAR